jgi:serine/threonine protein kinase/Tol biopolymer transport system component
VTISTGVRLGPYEVVALIGAGGMGEVWRARDTRLERSVAIKVLPSDFANNAQLRLRFEREAKAISQLAHPNICTVYDVGHENGVDFLVMEYLEGETLADRLSKGPLPLEQIVRYGVQIAEALEKTHKAGVVHRDVKPGNIMLTKSGVKLLDFGLAKPAESAAVALTSTATEKKPLTEEGAIVGTFQYMAPEQLEGGDVDARTDIFALGAVLYEMATGRRAFAGKTRASLIASILTAEPPPITSIQPTAPPSLDRVVRTCLAKEKDERWQSAHDVAVELRWVLEAQPDVAKAKQSRVAWIAAALLLLAAIGATVAWWRARSAPSDEQEVRSYILPPENAAFNLQAPPELSPDGKRVVFGASEPGKNSKWTLWVRSLDSLSAQQLAGTEEATFPFWSPDGRFVAFFAENTLKKIGVSGGAPVRICDVADARGGSWSPDGQTIVFAGRQTAIFRVPAAGGTPVAVTKLQSSYSTHRWPLFLPDGRHFLFLASPVGDEAPENTICAGSVDGKTYKPLVSRAGEPHYADGMLLFVRGGVLSAQPFDAKTLELSADAAPLHEQQIDSIPLISKSVVSVARNGTLIYQTVNRQRTSQLTWFDRSGKMLGTVGGPGSYQVFSLSPDQKSVAVSFARNIWSFDLVRGVNTRLTFGNDYDFSPIWSPDGRKLIYVSISSRGEARLVLKDLGSGNEQELMSADLAIANLRATSWSSDGTTILYNRPGKTTRADIWWISLAERKPHLYLGTPADETTARFSPDGKWVAYVSEDSSNLEVYVAPFPPTGAKWQVSTGGGLQPHWRGDGNELFFVATGTPAAMMAVPIHLGATPEIGQAVKLFGFHRPGQYDVTSDGQRFLLDVHVGEEPPPPPIILLQHFDRELRAALRAAP